MPRARRVFFDGAMFHVFNRLGRGEHLFRESEFSDQFMALLREVLDRDGVTLFAWCLMSNHYHLVVRVGPVALDRPMRSLQQRFTRYVNGRRQVFGPLWQGRYKAKLVEDDRYFRQVVAYVHLNPVVTGVVDAPGDYRWSGHGELTDWRRRETLVDVDEVLRLFGKDRRSARRSYVAEVAARGDEEWIANDPGRLPWWRLGRPPKRELEDPDESGRTSRSAALERQMLERPALTELEFLHRGCRILGVDLESLRARRGRADVVRARELLATLGVERWALRGKYLAAALDKHPVTASGWVERGIRQRRQDPDFAERYERLDRLLATEGPPGKKH